jgi:very-short-patch-repair endonuclease/DNA polymerase III delta prime subunit
MDLRGNANIEAQVGTLRKNLLDLSMKNQLLNFRPYTRSIKVEDEIPTEVYSTLVLDEKKMQFTPRAEKEEKSESEASDQEEDLSSETSTEHNDDGSTSRTPEEESVLWNLPKPQLKVKEKYSDLLLQTNLTAEELQKRLFRIGQQSRSMVEEQGYNILYIAMGFLEWSESSESENVRKAPLLLVPVELERKKVKGPFKLRWTGEEIIPNISLHEKLTEQNIELPELEMPESKDELYNYFKAVKKAVSSKKDWKVIYEIYLGFFSFTKFVMYKDLDPESWSGEYLEGNPIINAIFDPSGDTCDEGFLPEDVDKKLHYKDVYHILDADSSQIAVIEDAKAGRNMVVEGPPGTGKSQTIVNLIAELISNGKTVLFVSEKMAALEVVKSRLDGIGLGEFCLELHSRKSKKKDVLNELERTLYKRVNPHISLENEFQSIEKLRSELDEYDKVLHTPFGEIGLSPFQLFGMKEECLNYFNDEGREMPRVRFQSPEKCSLSQYNETVSNLKIIQELVRFLKPISKNPWKNCMPTNLLPSDEDEVGSLLKRTELSLENLRSELEYLSQATGLEKPRNMNEISEFLSSADMISHSKQMPRDVLKNPEWDGGNGLALELIGNLETFNEYRSKLSMFQRDVLNMNVQPILREYRENSSKLLRSFRGGYKKARNHVSSLYLGNVPEKDEEVIKDLEYVVKCQRALQNLVDLDEAGQGLFGNHWNGSSTDPESLKELIKWMVPFRKMIVTGKAGDKTIELVSSGVDAEDLSTSAHRIHGYTQEIRRCIHELDSYLKIDFKSIFGKGIEEVSFTEITAQVKVYIEGLSSLQKWSQFLEILRERPNTMVDPIIELVTHDEIETDDLIPCFRGNLADELLRSVFNANPVLSGFISELHEGKIERFIDTDRKIISLNRKRISSKLSMEKPSLNGAPSRNSELGILLSEFNRKRGHMPIRQLLSNTCGLVQRIKPCFMMSPLSVAQFLDPQNSENVRFDVVVFDEASQVKPEDALGAFLRGNQAVVMGDTRQLPPTSFFDTMADAEDVEDYELSSISDMESILHLCKRSFPTKMLHWHYRSRHESLIALSNQEFYNNELLIYPSPCHDTDKMGLKFQYLPEAVYDRGRSSSNRVEAKKVVEAAMDHYRRFGWSKSLGIGTFNIKQQQAIQEELELQLKLNSELEEFFTESRDEAFFIKNLETIQGDERDVIFVSVGYGKDQNGRLSLNFGPLNRDGGERRLNVLITRARERCVVFSNFRSRDINVTQNSAFGVRALKSFLEYAETGHLESVMAPGEDTESPFEDSVYRFLVENGHEVHKQVGCAGFRIDLAVINPHAPGTYLLGVECDGASYHSSQVARDRDRLRQQILEGLGWKIYRIWSTDWYRNRADAQKRLLEAINEASTATFHENLQEEVEAENGMNTVQIMEAEIEDEIGDRVETPLEVEGETMKVEVPYDHNREPSSNRDPLDLAEIKQENELKTQVDTLDPSPVNSSSTHDVPWDKSSVNDNSPVNSSIDQYPVKDSTSLNTVNEPDFSETKVVDDLNIEADNSHSEGDDYGSVVDQSDLQGSYDAFKSSEDSVLDYEVCSSLCIPVTGEIHEKHPSELAKAVTQIVEVEGPVHFSEVVRRIRVAWGLKKAGKRIQDAVLSAVVYAKQKGDVISKGDFLFYNGTAGSKVKVRRRCGDPPARIGMICDDEIAEAVKIVISRQFATPRDELVKQTSRILGFKVTRGGTASRIGNVVNWLLETGELEILPNGMINFPKQ